MFDIFKLKKLQRESKQKLLYHSNKLEHHLDNIAKICISSPGYTENFIKDFFNNESPATQIINDYQFQPDMGILVLWIEDSNSDYQRRFEINLSNETITYIKTHKKSFYTPIIEKHLLTLDALRFIHNQCVDKNLDLRSRLTFRKTVINQSCLRHLK